jgi:hypothetical protein
LPFVISIQSIAVLAKPPSSLTTPPESLGFIWFYFSFGSFFVPAVVIPFLKAYIYPTFSRPEFLPTFLILFLDSALFFLFPIPIPTHTHTHTPEEKVATETIFSH